MASRTKEVTAVADTLTVEVIDDPASVNATAISRPGSEESKISGRLLTGPGFCAVKATALWQDLPEQSTGSAQTDGGDTSPDAATRHEDHEPEARGKQSWRAVASR